MTYCVAMLLDTGLVFLSDSRTSAGVDQINTFRKTVVLQKPGERVLVLQGAGNLALSQAVVTILRERIDAARSSSSPAPHVLDTPTCSRRRERSGTRCGRCIGAMRPP